MVLPSFYLEENDCYTFIFKEKIPIKMQKNVFFYFHEEEGPCIFINDFFLIPFSYVFKQEPGAFTVKIGVIKGNTKKVEMIEQVLFDERWWGGMKGYVDMIAIFQSSPAEREVELKNL